MNLRSVFGFDLPILKGNNRSWTEQEKVLEKGNGHCMLHWQQLTDVNWSCWWKKLNSVCYLKIWSFWCVVSWSIKDRLFQNGRAVWGWMWQQGRQDSALVKEFSPTVPEWGEQSRSGDDDQGQPTVQIDR